MMKISKNNGKVCFLSAVVCLLLFCTTLAIPLSGRAEQSGIIETASWLGDLDVMKEKGVIRFLVPVENPFFLVDGFHKYGIISDTAVEFEKYVNREMVTGTFLRVVVIPVNREKMFDRLLEGYGDILVANLTVTPKRLKIVDFSDSLKIKVNEIVVAAPDAPMLTSLDDLSGKTVTVRKQSSYYEHLQDLNKTFKQKGLPPVSFDIMYDPVDDSILLAMLNEELIAYSVMDDWKPGFWKNNYPACVAYPDIQVHSDGQIAWALRKNSPLLKNALDQFVRIYTKNIFVEREKLHNKVDKDLVNFSNLKPQIWEKFKAHYALFKRIGEEYNITPEWLAAIAYVKSGFDQEKIGKNGEIGIMQLQPFIARQPEVDIPDITSVEKNVEAAAKYLRFLQDTYYNQSGMTDADRNLFAVAGYIVGPEKIKTSRWISGQMGQSPDEWFNEVAVVVSRRMGRETERTVLAVAAAALSYQTARSSGKERWHVE